MNTGLANDFEMMCAVCNKMYNVSPSIVVKINAVPSWNCPGRKDYMQMHGGQLKMWGQVRYQFSLKWCDSRI